MIAEEGTAGDPVSRSRITNDESAVRGGGRQNFAVDFEMRIIFRPVVLLALALLVAVCTWGHHAGATSISPYRWADMQGLAQNADVIAIGQVLSRAPGNPQLLDSESAARVAVGRVLSGDASVASTEVRVMYSAGDDPLDGMAGKTLLLFLRKNPSGPGYSLAFFHNYGAIEVKGNDVQLWIEGKPHGQFHSVTEVMAKIAALPRARVQWEARIDPNPHFSAGNVAVDFVAKNTGTAAILVMPPSFHFDAIISYPLYAGKWDPDRAWWTGVSHWTFARPEALVSLAPGAERRFHYLVPMAELGIKDARDFDVTLRLEAHRTSGRADPVIEKMPKAQIWLGGMPPKKVRVHVDP